MSKTINQALKDLYLSLGGDPSALEDNSTVSDYIADLENGLKGLAELPAPSSTNSGKIAKVVSDGEGGYIWGAENETQELPAVESTDINKLVGVVPDGASGAEYGLISAPQGFKRFIATIEYDSDSSKYYYMKNGQKSTAQQFAVDVQGYDEIVIKLVGVPESSAFDPDVFIYQMRSLDGQTLTAFRADFCNCIYNGDYTFYVNIVVYYNETESNDYVMVTIE